MEFTGERVVPGEVEPDLFNEHLARYLFVRQFVSGREVLDLGCGSGYGSSLIAGDASRVVGLDVSPEAVQYSRENFSAPNLYYLVSDAAQTGLASSRFDVVVCFEVIEHLARQENLVEEACRLLKPDGMLVVSTPNRVFYTEERQLVNPYHTREFDFQEFRSFLGSYFPQVEVFYQNHISSIFVGGARLPLKVVSKFATQDEEMQATSNFFVAVCSKEASGPLSSGSLVYLSSTGNLLREKEQRIEKLESQVKERDRKVLKLQNEYDQQTHWCLQLDETLRERESRILELQKEYDETAASFRQSLNELDERTAWAKRLSEENTAKDQQILKL